MYIKKIANPFFDEVTYNGVYTDLSLDIPEHLREVYVGKYILRMRFNIIYKLMYQLDLYEESVDLSNHDNFINLCKGYILLCDFDKVNKLCNNNVPEELREMYTQYKEHPEFSNPYDWEWKFIDYQKL